MIEIKNKVKRTWIDFGMVDYSTYKYKFDLKAEFDCDTRTEELLVSVLDLFTNFMHRLPF